MSAERITSGDGRGTSGTPQRRDLDFSCKSDDPPQESEVRVEVKEDGKWVRIPVTMCELSINKDGPADITRTAKVKFPLQWGGHDIAQYINGFSGIDDNEYDECRIWFYDGEPTDENHYEINHYGYIGSIGPAAETGVGKFWVYDPADLMRGIKVSETFEDPTIYQILDFVQNGYDDQGRPVGINHRTIFDNIGVYLAGEEEVRKTKEHLEQRREDGFGFGVDDEEDADWSIETPDLPVVGSFQIDITNSFQDMIDYYFGTDVTEGVWRWGSDKQFKLNRHNMVDLMNWFAERLEAKWHFEPTPEGPVLFFDNTKSVRSDGQDKDEFSRREFFDRNIFGSLDSIGSGDPSDFENRDVFEPVDVIHNQALIDIKPINSLELLGEAHNPSDRTPNVRHTVGTGMGAQTEEFPFVRLEHTNLVQNANGQTYEPSAVESDAERLEDAEVEAKKEFRKHLEEETEGNMVIKGDPYIMPYDYITVNPICRGTFSETDVPPIEYEVNSVTHRRTAEEPYKTKLGVSIKFSDSDINIVTSEYREA